MIRITELHGRHRYVNADLIELIETAPDTQLVMRDGRRIFVRESPEEIVGLVIAYKQYCNHAPPAHHRPAADDRTDTATGDDTRARNGG